MLKKRTIPTAIPAKTTGQIPEWVEKTPDSSFQLAMFDQGTEIQFIELDRVEYIALKERLAALRGVA